MVSDQIIKQIHIYLGIEHIDNKSFTFWQSSIKSTNLNDHGTIVPMAWPTIETSPYSTDISNGVFDTIGTSVITLTYPGSNFMPCTISLPMLYNFPRATKRQFGDDRYILIE